MKLHPLHKFLIGVIILVSISVLLNTNNVEGRTVILPLWDTTNSIDIFNTNTGNVGIGIVNPLDKLHVKGNIIIDGGVLSPVGGQNLQLILKPPHSIVLSDNVGTSLLQVNADGNVGIGTATPVEKLTVDGNIRMRSQYQGSFIDMTTTTANIGARMFYLPLTPSFGFKLPGIPFVVDHDNGNVVSLLITPTGNVGIGFAGNYNPAQKLEVDGTILGALPLTDAAITHGSGNMRYGLMAGAVPSTGSVMMRYRETQGGTLQDPATWSSWTDFGTPDPNTNIEDVSVDITTDDTNYLFGIVTARMTDGKVYVRYRETQGGVFFDPLLWTSWTDFGNPGI